MVDAMVEAAIDRDLAISLLEQVWPEEAIYEIPDAGPENEN